MVDVTFQGIAPIPTGTVVEMDVDDVNQPKEAFSVTDVPRKITYHFRPAPSPRVMKALGVDPGGFIRATVDSVQVFQNSTVLTISNAQIIPRTNPAVAR